MEKGFEFLLDSREKSNIQMLVKLKKFPHRITALPAGDFCLKDYNVNPCVSIVGIERKAIADLVQSIQSQRIFSQVRRMKMHYKIPFLFISGDVDDYTQKMTAMGLHVNTNVIYGTVASFICRNGIRTEWFPDDGSLVEVAYRLCEKVSEGKWEKDDQIGPKYMNFHPSSVLELASGVTRDSALTILKHFGNIKTVANLTPEQLQVVPGIGPQTALNIWKIFNNSEGYETTGPDA